MMMPVLFALIAAIGIVLGVPPVRRRLVTRWVLRALGPALPRMSETERIALEAGTVWFDGDLFSGRPDWIRFLDQPSYQLSPRERDFLEGPVQGLCRLVDDWDTTRTGDLPPEAWTYIKEHGFWGMIIPEAYGGLGFSASAHSAVIATLASRSAALAVTVMVPNSLGPAELLLHFGTDEQKRYYLPRLARGDEIPCFALTEPNAGSDASGIRSRGIVQRRGDRIGIELTWDKRYITLAPVATVIGLAFRLYDPDHLLGPVEDRGITCALVPAHLPGVQIGRRHDPLGVPFLNGPTSGRGVFVGLDCLIGGPELAGEGWRMLMQSLSAGRGISLPSLSAGATQLAARATGAYATIREQFRLPIGRFEGVQDVIAAIAGTSLWIDAVRRTTAAAVDSGEQPSVVSAIAKGYATEGMRQAVNDAMDVAGGAGIVQGPKNILARTYASLPIGITVEGANILTRTMIVFGQGVLRCHPHVQHEVRAAEQKDLVLFDRHFFAHLRFVLRNLVRTPWLAWTAGRPGRVQRGPRELQPYFGRLTRASAALALTSDFAMATLGGALKRKERLTGRLADVLAWTFIGAAVLKHMETRSRTLATAGASPTPGMPQASGARTAKSGGRDPLIPAARWALEQALYEIDRALDRFLANLPNRPAAWLLRRFVFPPGTRRYRGPSDRLSRDAARSILEGGAARTQLTESVFIPSANELGLGQLEDALDRVLAARSPEAALRLAIQAKKLDPAPAATLVDRAVAAGIIDERGRVLLEAASLSRALAIAVDSFDAAELERVSPPLPASAPEPSATPVPKA